MLEVKTNRMLKAFPPPRFLEMPAVGLDISDATIKFVEFVQGAHGLEVGRFGEQKVPEGVVVSGDIKNPEELSRILTELKETHNLHFVRASLPEEKGYLFEATVPSLGAADMRSSVAFTLEENVPLKPEQAVFDFDRIGSAKSIARREQRVPVVVSVFSRADVESYVNLFTPAGLLPLSLEIEAQALARAVVPNGDLATYMIVDYGRARSGISLVSGGVVRFTATIGVGGDTLTNIIQKAHPESDNKTITQLKNEEGLGGAMHPSPLQRELREAVHTLRGEIEKYIVYWQTHGEASVRAASTERSAAEERQVEKVLVCGGSANLAGLPEYLARELRISVERANVWTNAFSLERYVPPIPQRESLGFASAIGLALHDCCRV